MKFLRIAALLAGALAGSVGATNDLSAQAQTSDQSGAMTLSFTIAKYVEFISHTPSRHSVGTELSPGMPLAAPDGIILREFRANTPYTLSVSGITADSKVRFVNAHGEEIQLDAGCRTWDTSLVQSDQPYYDWDCNGGTVFEPRSSGWASLRLTLATAPHARAGEYLATVFFVIESM
jgi:hypothetical protein